VYSPAWKPEYVHYLTNYRIIGKAAYVIVFPDQDPVFVVTEPNGELTVPGAGWPFEVASVTEAPEERIADYLGGEYKRVGMAGFELLTKPQVDYLQENCTGVEITSELGILNRAALIKTEWEIGILKRCAAIADAGFNAQLQALRPGITEYELVAEIEFAMRNLGADDNFQMIAAGRDLTGMNVPGEKAVAHEDLVLSEITPMIGCITYATQLCRSVKLGKSNRDERDAYDLLVEALNASLNIIKPGLPAGQIAQKQNEIIGGAGYEKYCGPPYMRSRGHNFGLGHIELEVSNDLPLAPNMVMVVHPNQYIPGIGYLACGETIRITESGYERLNSSAPQLYEA
jgi:Xaa-Pro aminopeptidase